MVYSEQNRGTGRSDASVYASLFGTFQLMAPDDSEIVVSNRRARALIAMLCLAPGEPIDREHIIKLLWPGRFEAQARSSLRQCLLSLKKVLEPLGDDILDVSRSRISLNPSALQTDLSELEAALARDQVADACALLLTIGGKPVLDHLEFGDAFRDWLAVRRQQTEQRLRTEVKRVLSNLEEAGNLADHSRLLEALRLRHPETPRALLADRKGARTRIAVLPFETFDGEEDQGYFADGIVDELISALGQVPELLVAGRTSSFHFRGSELTLPDIASALHVGHLVEGSVQRQDNDVRINVRLIDGVSGFESWAYSYDGTVDDIFMSREEVARKVTTELCVALKLKVEAPPIRRMTGNIDAFRLYLQGRALTNRAIGEGLLKKAIEQLEQALALDPDFAECWTALAEAHVFTIVYTPCPDRIAETERMAACARRAIELAPHQGHAYAMLGLYEWTRNNAVGALDLAYKAFSLEPNNPDVVIRLGSFLLYCGRTREALPYIEAAIDQDPSLGRNHAMMCVANLNLGNIDAAIAAGQRMVDFGFPSMWLAVATRASGNKALAIEQYKQTRSLMNTVLFLPEGVEPDSPEMIDAYWEMAARGVCGDEKDRQHYCQALEMLYATLHDKYDPSIVLAAIWMGYAQMVFKTLGQQITPANMMTLMSLWADIEPIAQTRRHPDFMPFAKHIGLIDAWEKYGWPDLMPRPDDWQEMRNQA